MIEFWHQNNLAHEVIHLMNTFATIESSGGRIWLAREEFAYLSEPGGTGEKHGRLSGTVPRFSPVAIAESLHRWPGAEISGFDRNRPRHRRQGDGHE